MRKAGQFRIGMGTGVKLGGLSGGMPRRHSAHPQLRHNWHADDRHNTTLAGNRLHTSLQLLAGGSHKSRYRVSRSGETALVMNDAVNEFSKSRIGGFIVLVLRAIGVAFGLFLMAVSIPLFFLPIPLGIPLFILAALLLAASSRTAHNLVTGVLKRFPPVWNRVKRMFGEKD